MDKENVGSICIYPVDYYSVIKKKENVPSMIAWMDLKGLNYPKWNKSDRGRQILHDHIFMLNQKKISHRKRYQICNYRGRGRGFG